MGHGALDETAEDLGDADGDGGSGEDTVTLVAVISDRTTRRTWTFTGVEGSFPSWAWR